MAPLASVVDLKTLWHGAAAVVEGAFYLVETIASMTWQQAVLHGVLWPCFAIFVALQVPVLGWLAHRFILLLGGLIRVPFFGGRSLSIFGFFSLLFLGLTTIEALEYWAFLGRGGQPSNTVGAEMEWLGKKWRRERNIYMTLVACVMAAYIDAAAALQKEEDAARERATKRKVD